MPGQCYSCGAEFGFFKKEHGCKNCGFAFCSSCLTKKTSVPKLQGEKHHVCNKCYDVLTGKTKPEEKGRISPPQAYKKRVAALEQRETEGASKGGAHKAAASKPNPKFASLDKPDRDIAQRLEKLKERPQEQRVTDADLNVRLARLKGEDPAARTAPSKPFYQPPDRRMQVEQVDDLLDEIANEVEIDSHQPDPAREVEDRLARLRGNKTETDTQEQNNLDKKSPTSTKNYVKNINFGSNGNAQNTGGGGSPGEEGGQKDEVDLAEVQALMERAASSLESDARRALEGLRQDKELMDRMAQIKQRHKQKEQQAEEQPEESLVDNALQDEEEDSEDEDLAAQRVLSQYLAEAKLDERVEQDIQDLPSTSATTAKGKGNANKEPGRAKDSDADGDYEDPDELPYCVLCTEDAVVRCVDCDMDLYCNKCFREGHKELGLSGHRSVPYKFPKGYR